MRCGIEGWDAETRAVRRRVERRRKRKRRVEVWMGVDLGCILERMGEGISWIVGDVVGQIKRMDRRKCI